MANGLAIVAALLAGQATPQAPAAPDAPQAQAPATSDAHPQAQAPAAPDAYAPAQPPARDPSAKPAARDRPAAPKEPASPLFGAVPGDASSAPAASSSAEGASAASPPAQAPGGADLAALQEQIAALRAQVYTLEQSLEAERAYSDQLADRVRTDEEMRRAEAEAAARSPGQRAAQTGAATADMSAALGALAIGDASGVDTMLSDNASVLGDAQREAGRRGASQEAQLAGSATGWIGVAREALSRSDLFQARVALANAAAAAAKANALARQSAGNGAAGAAPAPPPSPGGY